MDDEVSGGSTADVAAPAGPAPLPIAEAPFSSVPLVLGEKALGPFRWTNTAHGGRHDPDWSGGSGIGVSELFVGLDDNVCMFGIHAESRGCDFINLLTPGSDPGVCLCACVCVGVCVCVHMSVCVCVCACVCQCFAVLPA